MSRGEISVISVQEITGVEVIEENSQEEGKEEMNDSKSTLENIFEVLGISGFGIIGFSLLFTVPWTSIPRTDSLISVIYLGVVPTGLAWLLRFRILKNNGLIFQAQVAYLIPIFGVMLGYIFLKELITIKVLISLIAVSVGIYFVGKADSKKLTNF